eukprot:m.237267 g.237267  ORF g.237267 m.237267 type:complete len:1218 (-) comp21028_c0_seq1:250-3903(-)
MYYPVGLPQVVRVGSVASARASEGAAPGAGERGGEESGAPPVALADVESEGEILRVAHSNDGIFMAVCCSKTIELWRVFPLVHLCTYRRTRDSLGLHGTNTNIIWRWDRRVLAVLLSKGYVQMLIVDEKSPRDQPPLYNIQLKKGHVIASGISLLSSIQSCTFKHMGPSGAFQAIPTSAPPLCAVNFKDTLLVASAIGVLEQFKWDEPFSDSSVTLSLSSIRLGEAEAMIPEGASVVHMAYSASMRALVLVLSSGRAVCVNAETSFHHASGSWIEPPAVAAGASAAPPRFLCAASNAKFRLLALGTNQGSVLLYTLDGAQPPRHVLTLRPEEALYPGAGKDGAEAVRELEWSPDAHVLAVGYDTSGVSLWTAFGSCLLRPLQDSEGSRVLSPLGCRSLSWAAEGFRLLLAPRPGSGGLGLGDLLYYSFVKSALTTCPCTANQATVLLLGEDRLYVNPDVNGRLADHIDKLCDTQWQCVPVPPMFYHACWPLRVAAIDQAGAHIAIAGVFGLALYNLQTHKWRMFGNVSQEHAFFCRGGLAWWRDIIFAGCTDRSSHLDDIRAYSSAVQLDERRMLLQTRVRKAVTLLNVCGDYLIAYSSARRVQIYSIAATGPDGSGVALSEVWFFDILEHVASPLSVVALSLLSLSPTNEPLRIDGRSAKTTALLANAGGKLMLFPIDISSQCKGGAPPTLLATGVEMYWAPCAPPSEPHPRQLGQAIWLACGAEGMKMWLALPPHETDELAVTKRVMLPLGAHASAVSVLFYDLVLVGASSDASPVTAPGGPVLPFYTLQRATHLYLHHILRQLLRRSLDGHALQIARSCVHHSYFQHTLELMLHEVLEDEAINNLAVVREDALLPRVAAFISHFPAYRQIIVHCARKTEVAKWAYLFFVVGSPRELFEQCVAERAYETAATYLMIMQALEAPATCQAFAAALLHTVLDAQLWSLSQDIIRFLKVMAESDTEHPAPKSQQEFVDHLLEPYARAQLEGGCVHQLGTVAARFRFRLVRWLRTIRNTPLARVSDFAVAVARVQRDFAMGPAAVPLPFESTLDDPPHRSASPLLAAVGEGARADWDAASTNGSESADISLCVEDLQQAIEGYQLEVKSERTHQLEYMFRAMLKSGCLEWAFVLALVLRDRAAITSVLDEVAMDKSYDGGIRALMTRFEPSLRTDSVSAYQEFYDHIAVDRRQAAPTIITEERAALPTPVEAEQAACVIS